MFSPDEGLTNSNQHTTNNDKPQTFDKRDMTFFAVVGAGALASRLTPRRHLTLHVTCAERADFVNLKLCVVVSRVRWLPAGGGRGGLWPHTTRCQRHGPPCTLKSKSASLPSSIIHTSPFTAVHT
jgi:hypothetical protein